MRKNNCALIIGGYVNGYSIIQELYEKNIHEIILFDNRRSVASYSNKIKEFVLIDETPESLCFELEKLREKYEKIIIFPTDDLQLEHLHKIYQDIRSFCFLPFNYENLLECMDKYIQYSYCEKLGVPYPKTILMRDRWDLETVKAIQFPILLKPNKREDMKVGMFRNLRLYDITELEKNKEQIEYYLSLGIKILASELIPGDGSNIYAYVAYRSYKGEILNEWIGKKLSQYPNNYGVFASASNQAPEEVLKLGRLLLNEMNIIGIAEPEFKYDYRDKQYKLMEINLRSMMWHRVGNLSDVNLQYSQYLDAIGKTVEKQVQIKDKDIHFVYLYHEIMNLINRKKYYKTFFNNIFLSDKTYFAMYEIRDIKPTIKGITELYEKLFSRKRLE